MARKTRRDLTALIDTLLREIKIQTSRRHHGPAERAPIASREIYELEKQLMALKRQRGDYRPRRNRRDARAEPKGIRSVV